MSSAAAGEMMIGISAWRMYSLIAYTSNAATGPISTWTRLRSTSSSVLVRVCAGWPAESPKYTSTFRPAMAPPRSLSANWSPSSICRPHDAIGPERIVRTPTRTGSCADAGAATRVESTITSVRRRTEAPFAGRNCTAQ